MKKFTKTILIFVFLLTGWGAKASWAYLPEITTHSKEEIVKFSDEDLKKAYIDVLVELEANRSFHETSGYAPREYQLLKDILRYKIYLRDELEKRSLKVPRLD